MKQDSTTPDPAQVYDRSIDKQRVVIAGGQSKLIAALVIHVLGNCKREFDYATQVPINGVASTFRLSDAPLIIIQENERPTASILKYHHHIGVISDVEPGDEPVFTQFADATPKAGTLIYAETNPALSIGKKERPDIISIPYKAYAHAQENGSVVIITSKNARVPIKLTGEAHFRSLSAAREILKKTGITSDQFYRSISGFEA